MATIRPFQGLRFDASAGPISDLVAPPYDVLSPEERDRYAAKNQHNIVHLTLPEQEKDDRSKFVKYMRSAARLQAWRDEGALKRESAPSFYRYVQEFSIPGGDPNERLSRTALVATIKVEPYEKGVVLPHEQTFPKHKEDRLRLLEATRAHLECIYGLYEDDDEALHGLVAKAAASIVADVTTEDGVSHRIEKVDDAETCKTISQRFDPKKVWIADGHHRYETALNFRAELGERSGEVAEDFMMMALSSIHDPGLVLLPTHRILDKVTLTPAEIRAKCEGAFEHTAAPNASLMAEIEEISAAGGRAFGLALPGGQGLILRILNVNALVHELEGPESARLKGLDVTILHEYVFQRILGLKGYEFFSYTRDPQEAVNSVENGAAATFLMNPPTVEDMRLIANGGEKMPQKSTYYYPKLLSGLVVWALQDFVP